MVRKQDPSEKLNDFSPSRWEGPAYGESYLAAPAHLKLLKNRKRPSPSVLIQ